MEWGTLHWQFWAVMSAAFAALTAIFAKIGIENVNSDFATFIRTIVILGAWQLFCLPQISSSRRVRSRPNLWIPAVVRPCHRSIMAVLFPRS